MAEEKIIAVMKRYELKFYLNKEQLAYFNEKIVEHMKLDKYGLTSIASLYYDTPDYRLINRSIEKPKYKEKLRLRSYGLAKEDSKTFLEIKRKSEGIVYKRRISLLEKEADELIRTNEAERKDQIGRELEAFLENYKKVEPKYLIIYDRMAYYQDDSDLRVTVDINPRYRTTDLNLHTSLEGTPLTDDGGAILEIKVQHSIPLWLTKILTEGKIYQTSFSKVGTAHIKEMKKQQLNTVVYEQQYVQGGRQYGFTI
ncbi:MAG: polyphosphate polymerase domain-containing protein [Erysipelotrichaceae bacterium]|nr:polyphosphate polymerase domain-containing protein [Erysipelotrichaceae bacterium]